MHINGELKKKLEALKSTVAKQSEIGNYLEADSEIKGKEIFQPQINLRSP